MGKIFVFICMFIKQNINFYQKLTPSSSGPSSARFNWTYTFRSSKFAKTTTYVEKYWKFGIIVSVFTISIKKIICFLFSFSASQHNGDVFVFQEQLPAAVSFTTRKTTTTARPPPRIGGRTCSSGTSCLTTTTTVRNRRSLPTRTISCSSCGGGEGDVGGTTTATTSAGSRPYSNDGDG